MTATLYWVRHHGRYQMAKAKADIGLGSAWQETDAWWLQPPYVAPA